MVHIIIDLYHIHILNTYYLNTCLYLYTIRIIYVHVCHFISFQIISYRFISFHINTCIVPTLLYDVFVPVRISKNKLPKTSSGTTEPLQTLALNPPSTRAAITRSFQTLRRPCPSEVPAASCEIEFEFRCYF